MHLDKVLTKTNLYSFSETLHSNTSCHIKHSSLTHKTEHNLNSFHVLRMTIGTTECKVAQYFFFRMLHISYFLLHQTNATITNSR